MRCEELTDELAGLADGSVTLDRPGRDHVEHCLACQAEAVQYRKLLRSLHNLRSELLVPAPGLLPEILAGLEEAGERHAVRSMLVGRRAAYLGGIAAATAAGAAIVLATRGRKGRLPLAG